MWKKNKEEIMIKLFFLVAILTNMIMFPNELINCEFASTTYNKWFLYIVIIPDLCLRLVHACMYRSNYLINERNTFLALLAPILAAGWWIWTLT